jgi:hypothetical protein
MSVACEEEGRHIVDKATLDELVEQRHAGLAAHADIWSIQTASPSPCDSLARKSATGASSALGTSMSGCGAMRLRSSSVSWVEEQRDVVAHPKTS